MFRTFSSVQFSHSVMSDSLRPHELQHTRPPCPSPTPRVHPNPCPLSQWCHPTVSSSVVPFSCPQSFPASRSFQMSQFLLTSNSRPFRAAWPLEWHLWRVPVYSTALLQPLYSLMLLPGILCAQIFPWSVAPLHPLRSHLECSLPRGPLWPKQTPPHPTPAPKPRPMFLQPRAVLLPDLKNVLVIWWHAHRLSQGQGPCLSACLAFFST